MSRSYGDLPLAKRFRDEIVVSDSEDVSEDDQPIAKRFRREKHPLSCSRFGDELLMFGNDRSALFTWPAPVNLITECGMFVLNNMHMIEVEPPIKIFGVMRKQRRCVRFFSASDAVKSFKYSGAEQIASRISDTPMAAMLDEINNRFGSRYNGLLVNVYRSQEEYISPHSDDVRFIDGNAGVVCYNYGAPRTLVIHDKTKNSARLYSMVVDGNCGYRMAGEFQNDFKHGIPQEKAGGGAGPRVSFTARLHN